MAHENPRYGLIFFFFPLNNAARELVQYGPNSHLQPTVSTATATGETSVDGIHIRGPSHGKLALTLTTIGRDADILVPQLELAPHAGISRINCSFEIREDSGEILLQDRSSLQNTQIDGPNAFPFELGRVPRRVLVSRKANTVLGFGNPDGNLFKFRIVWLSGPPRMVLAVAAPLDNPRMMRTQELRLEGAQDGTAFHPGSVYEQPLPLRYIKDSQIGSGWPGNVHKAVDVGSGRLLAAKEFVMDENMECLLREVEILKSLSHPHILEFICAQSMESTFVIFTPLKDGNVGHLIDTGVSPRQRAMASTLLYQMFQASDYLDRSGVIHRDVKPANILHSRGPIFLFQLADFGMSNYVSKARTLAGSVIWMAPEVMNNKGVEQTPKVDVWSLFVVLVQVINVRGFHDKIKHLKKEPDILVALREECADEILVPLKPMAEQDPAKRSSAGDMLDVLFKGVGRTSPRHVVNLLPDFDESSTPAPVRVPQLKVMPSLAGNKALRARKTVKKQPEPPAKVAKVMKIGERRRQQAGTCNHVS
ncbi:kinase-like domain-containing protein [Macrophomina phaseolina]|uniref:non-specific serine/threonine protein kinase n=1 Tax=Macrophomina phaseolina TaxID=35725 RepID=A0ABQ8FRI3_9PEZI|nr:kinase-like domain-containing protein [Macrophomina phaseolina]